MEIPENCLKCPLRNQCEIFFDWFGSFDTPATRKPYPKPFMKGCRIVCQLPEGHGRLIDIDSELNFQIADYEDMKARGDDVYSKLYSLDDVAHAINYAYDYADVVVPAEKRVE